MTEIARSDYNNRIKLITYLFELMYMSAMKWVVFGNNSTSFHIYTVSYLDFFIQICYDYLGFEEWLTFGRAFIIISNAT